MIIVFWGNRPTLIQTLQPKLFSRATFTLTKRKLNKNAKALKIYSVIY